MKTCLFLLTMLAAGSLAAQSAKTTNKTATTPAASPSLSATHIAPKVEPPNQITRGRFVYSGVLVQVAKTKEPLELINPFAPVEYGTGDCNLHRDIITGKPVGFKFFSIKF